MVTCDATEVCGAILSARWLTFLTLRRQGWARESSQTGSLQWEGHAAVRFLLGVGSIAFCSTAGESLTGINAKALNHSCHAANNTNLERDNPYYYYAAGVQ